MTASLHDTILERCGHAPAHIEPGSITRFATSGKASDKSGWVILFDDLCGAVFGDYRTGFSEVWTAKPRQMMSRIERTALELRIAQSKENRRIEQAKAWERNAIKIKALLDESHPLVPGDPVTLYLKRRGIRAWPLPFCLRYCSSLAYWHEGGQVSKHPGMLAPLVDLNGKTVAVHRTYLAYDGRKADVPTVKKLTGTGGSIAGAYIPLGKPPAGVLGVAEGIETALAAWEASGVPTISTYSAANLAALKWPANISRLVIFADNDESGTGQRAAHDLAKRARTAGLSVDVMLPTEPGSDWCDVWASRRAITVESTGGAA